MTENSVKVNLLRLYLCFSMRGSSYINRCLCLFLFSGHAGLICFFYVPSFGLQVKNRWAGKTIVDLFTDEFKGRSREYYV
jgi:hypothetical protein